MAAFFSPTTFDKAFIRAVEFIDKEGLLSSRSWLASEIGITPQALSAIMKQTRGLPVHKRSLAIFVLANEFQVRPDFLKTNRGPILTTPIEINKDEFPQYAEVSSLLEDCKKEVATLMERLKEKDELISAQRLVIEKFSN